MWKKKRRKIDGVQFVSTFLIIAFSLFVFIPFWNAVVISLETSVAATKYPFSIVPMEFTLDNYKVLVRASGDLLKSYWVTIKLTVISTVVGMTICLLAAYGFSRNFPGKRLLFRLAMFTMYFGGGLFPVYMQLKNMNLLNFTGCVMIGLVSVYNVIIMKNGFESVPMALQEAAMIDGANELCIFRKVMIPLQKPLIATFTLFSIVGNWNGWYWPMIVGGEVGNVLQLFLRRIINNVSKFETQGGGGSIEATMEYAEGIKMAAVFVVMVPIMVVYPFLQKYFTKGIMVGAVKM